MSLTAFGELQTAELTPLAGWTFAYNVNTDIVATTTAGSGAISGASGFAVLSTGAAVESKAKIATRLPLRYIPGQGALARFTAIFTPGVAGSHQIVGVGDDDDGLFFGYNGAAFGVLRRSAGVDTWIAQDDWSHDSAWTRKIDHTRGNVFQIQFQWLGFGELRFFIENNDSGGLEIAHRIQYANTSTATSLLNPTLPVMAEVANTTNATAITLRTPSAMAFCEGKIDNPPPPHPLALARALTAAKAGVSTQANVVTLKNQATWQSKANRIRSQIRNLSIATDGTKPAIIRLIKNTTLGGSPSYADHSADTSPIQIDTAGTTITGGSVVFAVTMDKIDSQIWDLDRWGVFVAPGETLTLSVQSAASTDVTATVGWVDLI